MACGDALDIRERRFFSGHNNSRAFSRLTNPPASSRWSFSCLRLAFNIDLLEGLGSGQMDSNPSNHMYLLIDSVSLRADGSPAFSSVFLCIPDDFLENLNVTSAGKLGISRVRVVRRRWTSLVRIQRRPFDGRDHFG